MMESTGQVVAAQVRAEMARRNMKQNDLARVLGISQQAVSPKYNGLRDYSLRDLWAISTWLEIPLAVLLGDLAQSTPQPPKPRSGVGVRPVAERGNRARQRRKSDYVFAVTRSVRDRSRLLDAA